MEDAGVHGKETGAADNEVQTNRGTRAARHPLRGISKTAKTADL